MSSVQVRTNVRTCLTDVDGTLFPFGSNRRLSDKNRVALQRAIEAGVHVGLATGRIPGAWSQSIRETLPSLGASVFCNGALVLGSDSCVIADLAASERRRRLVLSSQATGGSFPYKSNARAPRASRARKGEVSAAGAHRPGAAGNPAEHRGGATVGPGP